MRKRIYILLHFLKVNFLNKRLFWICVLISSGWNMGSIFVLMFKRFNTDSTSIGVTTTYIQWSNIFPAVTICLIKNKVTNNFTTALKRRNTDNKTLSNAYIKNILEYLFVTSENSYIKEEYCKGYNSTCGVDILDLRRELLPQHCSKIFKTIFYADVLLSNCTTIFKFHELEMGNCFLSNNLIDYENNDQLPLKYTSLDKQRSLKLVLQSELIYKYQIYIHSPEEVPYFNAIRHIISTRPTVHNINVEEIHNKEDVIFESVNQRMCKFPSETSNSIFNYSFSNCLSQIRSAMEMKICNCNLFNPLLRNQTYCDIEGIKCLQRAQISAEVKEHVGKNLVCLPSCMEQQISYVGSIERANEGNDFIVEIQIANPPTARFFRTVTQTKLDLIVAVGGVLGLFIGASLLNIIEVLSMFCHYVYNYCIN